MEVSFQGWPDRLWVPELHFKTWLCIYLLCIHSLPQPSHRKKSDLVKINKSLSLCFSRPRKILVYLDVRVGSKKRWIWSDRSKVNLNVQTMMSTFCMEWVCREWKECCFNELIPSIEIHGTFMTSQTLVGPWMWGSWAMTLYLMEHAFQWRGVPDGTLVSFPSYLEFKPRSSPWASRPPAQLLPFALTPVKPSWHFLFSGLVCPRAFALAMPSTRSALPRYLPGLSPHSSTSLP